MVSGFSIIKNGESLGYPFVEALLSLAPFVDEIVVAHGDSTDGTAAALESIRGRINCPLRIIDSPWDSRNQRAGSELARQTNLALDACAHDVCFYIQADEVLCEDDTGPIRADLRRFREDDEVDGLALTWEHFYGDFDVVVRSRKWYRREIRVVKRSRRLRSYGDAQGFRIERADGGWEKPRAALSRGRMFHYGWVRPVDVMIRKTEALDRLWHGSARDGSHDAQTIYPRQFGMQPFRGNHPSVMSGRIATARRMPKVEYTGDVRLRDRIRFGAERAIEAGTGWRPGEFRNYRTLKKY